MLHAFSRTEILIGKEGLEKLANSKVAVFGIGGVGSFTVEALARTGIGRLVLIDDDDICLTNLNRQLHATVHTVGRPKVEVMKERILSINPSAEVTALKVRSNAINSAALLNTGIDYVVDAIDMVSSKIDLVLKCREYRLPIISSMGAGNKFDASQFQVADLFTTRNCPLARIMRKELRKRNVEELKVVYSPELPVLLQQPEDISNSKVPGTLAFMPSVAGLILAGEVIRDLLKIMR